MYLSPNKMPEWPDTSARTRHLHISTPDKVNVLLNVNAKLFREDGTFKDTWFRMSLRKVGASWKLLRSSTLECSQVQITVKHIGSGEWTPVEILASFPGPCNEEEGTTFNHGDQLNMRYVHSSGQSSQLALMALRRPITSPSPFA